jgi:urease accessory protein
MPLAPRASTALLMLADGRFPAGGHAHSGGLEEAVTSGRTRDISDLRDFLTGRLNSVGRTDAFLAALSCAAVRRRASLEGLQAEALARSPSPAQREASRAQARGLLRAASAIWPETEAALQGRSGAGLPPAAVYPVALGAVGMNIGLGADQVALVAALGSVSGPAWAATRLLGLDPFSVVGCLAALAASVEALAAEAGRMAESAVDIAEAAATLPALSAPLLEVGAESHSRREVRLFAS